MLSSLPLVLIVGTILGFLAGMGVGGGTLLMLWLTLVLDIPQATARSINLMFFLPGALIASIFRRKQGALDLKQILPGAAAGCAAAALAAWIAPSLDLTLIKKLFGGLLIAAGLRELLYRRKV